MVLEASIHDVWLHYFVHCGKAAWQEHMMEKIHSPPCYKIKERR
jgi:hypothetical protein